MKPRGSVFSRLCREIFLGGDEYRTVKGRKTPFPAAMIFRAALITVLLLILTFTLIRISEVGAELAAMRKEAVTLADKEDKLRDELDRKYPYADREAAASDMGYAKDNGKAVVLPSEEEEQ